MKVLVIGGAGFLGTKIVNHFLSSNYGDDVNYEVTVYDNFSKSNLTVLPLGCTIIQDDISNISNFKDKLKNFDIVYYLAQPRLGEINDNTKQQAVEDLKHTLDLISPNTRFIFTSSCSVYGISDEQVTEESPVKITSPYSAMKIECENLIKSYNKDNLKILRLATLFGIGKVSRPDLMINNFVLDILNGEIEIFDANALRPHFDVDDASIALRVLGEIDYEETILNVGHKSTVFTKKQLVKEICNVLTQNPKLTIFETKDSRNYSVDFYKFDIITNFMPTKFSKSLKNLSRIGERINASLEGYDNLTKYYLPNTASPTWYVKEEGRFGFPKSWGWWNVIDEDFNLFNQEVHRTLVTPSNFLDSDINYLTKSEVGQQKHLYIVHAFNGDYFKRNKDIGLNCVSEQYIEHFKTGQSKLVFICTLEGYAGSEDNKDFETIQSWINSKGIPGENVYYITGNLISPQVGIKKGITFNLIPVCMFDSWMPLNIVDLNNKVDFNPIDDKYLYLSYARQPRDQRIALGTRLLKNGLLDKGKVSLGKFNYAPNYDYIDSPEILKQLANLTPIEIDRTLHYNLAADLTLEDYEQTFISVINETLTSKDTLFLSEKIWKPLLVGHPFAVIGNVGTIKYLKNLGYKTFNKWWDESYDEEPDFLKRVDKVVDILNKLKSYSTKELQGIKEEMQSILDYNKNHFIKSLKIKYGLKEDLSFISEPMKPIKTELVKIFNSINIKLL